MPKDFFLLDGRAKNPDDASRASILDIAHSEEEARSQGLAYWRDYDAIWYEDGMKPRWDIPPARAPHKKEQ